MKQCISCNKDKQEKEFGIFRGKQNKQCLACREYHNRFYAENKNGKQTKAKEYYLKHKDKFRKRHFQDALKRKYKLSLEVFEAMKTEQNNKCAICNQEFNGNQVPCVDHSHETNEIRGLLCRKCNLALQVVENKEFVQKATSYLNKLVK